MNKRLLLRKMAYLEVLAGEVGNREHMQGALANSS